ncbi:hypothetical protein Ndes2526A_g05500 [Nannochloris sp. 'desiccata']
MDLTAHTRHTKCIHSQKSYLHIPGFWNSFPSRIPFKRNTTYHRHYRKFSSPVYPTTFTTMASTVTMPSPTIEAPKKQISPPLTVYTSNGNIVSSSGAVILQNLPNEGNMTSRCSDDGTALILGISSSTPTSSLDVALGTLTARRYLALGRTSLWWMSPYWGCPGNTDDAVPAETQFLLLQLEDGSCALLLPLLDSGKFRATLRNSTQHTNSKSTAALGMRVESGAATITATDFSSALYIAAGIDPYELIARGVAAAASLSGTAKPRTSKSVPPIADKFLWCTWDAYYSTISAEGVKLGLAALVAGGTPPKGVIIDDGWQVTDVDPMYRREKEQYPLLSRTAAATAAADRGGGLINSAGMEVDEAAAELLAGPGDQNPDMLKGEHEIITEATSGTTGSTGTHLVGKLRRGVGHLIASFEAALLHVGKYLLDSAHSDSLIIRAFTALATGPLKANLLRFYAHATDHTRRLSSIKANAKFATPGTGATGISLAAPGGDLSTVVSSIKSDYGVEYVYAWHAMGGFWGGLGVQDPEMAKYKSQLLLPVPTPSILEVDPAVAWVQPVVAGVSLPLDPTLLHHEMHEYLASCGVDGVKVDVQGTIGLAGSSAADGSPGGPALAAAYHRSLEASVARHFPGNHLINCMCHSTEDLYNFKDSNLARVSDDFYPRRPASHTSHIANCSFNSLFMGEIVIPDYDMFHSKHPSAFLHATARAVSGSPVYVSDKPGHHDFDLLKRLVFSDGSVLRALLPGRPTADCLFENVSHDNTTALKIWNMNSVNGVVGVFNVQGSSFSRRYRSFRTHDSSPPTLTAVVKPEDVPPLMGTKNKNKISESTDGDGISSPSSFASSTGLCVLYSDRSGAMSVVDMDSSTGIEVQVAPNGGCDVITICPVVSPDGGSDLDGSDVLFAPVGLVNMLNAGGAVMSCDDSSSCSSSSSLSISMKIRGVGQFLAFASHRPVSVEFDGKNVEFEYEEARSALRFIINENENGPSSAERLCSVQF